MHWFLCAEDSERELRSELAQAFPGAEIRSPHAAFLETDFEASAGRRLPWLAFSRQFLPNARPVRAASVSAWARELFAAVSTLPEGQPWVLHIAPHYGGSAVHRIGARAWHSLRRQHPGPPARPPAPLPTTGRIDPGAGRNRCELIRRSLEELLRAKRRHLLRHLVPDLASFGSEHSLVQLFLFSPEEGCLSVAPAPFPGEQRHLLSPFPRGEVPPARDPAAPSRAFAKLAESEARLGRQIAPGEICVDLGAAPGSWTYWALQRGARVIAVDRSPLRDDLQRHARVRFQEGDAFDFRPDRPADWLLCDVIAPPDKTAELLLEWLRRGWCRNFVVTLKLRDAEGLAALERVKEQLPPLTDELFLTRLCSNKKEVCAFGRRAERGAA